MVDPLKFPAAFATNVLRGALGLAFHQTNPSAYFRLFEPTSPNLSADGLRDRPRPFVLRTRLDGVSLHPGDSFDVKVHAFTQARDEFVQAFTAAGEAGFGARRSRARLEDVCEDLVELPVVIDWDRQAAGLLVDFLTPTELKARSAVVTAPTFAILIARTAERINNLRSLYGGGPVEISMRELRGVASQIGFGECRLNAVKAERRSGRTHQTHPLGGFLGTVEYVGNAAPFLGLLKIGEYTGVGRQASWGKGEIKVTECGS